MTFYPESLILLTDRTKELSETVNPYFDVWYICEN